MKFTNIYATAEEKYVKNVVLYAKTGDNYLYADSTHTQKIDKDTLMNLLIKGVIVLYEGAYYTPVMFKDNTTNVSATIATNIATGASTSVVLYSEEYLAD